MARSISARCSGRGGNPKRCSISRARLSADSMSARGFEDTTVGSIALGLSRVGWLLVPPSTGHYSWGTGACHDTNQALSRLTRRRDPMEREIVNPSGVAAPLANYSHVARVGNTLYISGQVGVDADNNLVGRGDAE